MVTITPAAAKSSSLVSCQPTDAEEDVVYIKSTSTTPYEVERADVYDPNKIPGVGVIRKKLSATTALVQFRGEINFSFSLLPGKAYFIGSGGKPSTTLPTKGLNKTYIQSLGVALNASTFLLNPDTSLLVQRG